jgi:hypothetical protein
LIPQKHEPSNTARSSFTDLTFYRATSQQPFSFHPYW